MEIRYPFMLNPSLMDQTEEKEEPKALDYVADMRAALNALCVEKCSKISGYYRKLTRSTRGALEA